MNTSYAQNFEDVMLWRALGQVAEGFYIDVGAQHPSIDSVSKAFYERGWRGVHVEPTTTYANLLRQDRPDETVLQAALTHTHGTLTFYEIPETGLSTADPAIAERHTQQGFEIRETTVPCLTLADVFERAGPRDIHWLKIDVEGFERQVLEGWGLSLVRPWIVVVESTLPLTTIESHAHWESLLLDRDYEHVYFDGLNRYYVSAAHPELRDAFRAPPNVFDDFALIGTASAPFCRLIRERHQAELACVQTELDQAKIAARQEITRATEALAAQQELHAKQELALGEQLRAANDAVRQLEFGLVNQSRASLEREQSLERDHVTRVESFIQQLQASQAELRQLTQEGAAREIALTQQTAQMRQDVAELLRTLAQRESEFARELIETRREVEQAAQEQALAHAEREQALHRDIAEREQALTGQLQTSQAELRRLTQEGIERERVLTRQTLQVRQEMEALLRSLAQREREFAQELLRTRREAEQATADQARAHAEQEQTLRHEHAAREQALSGRITQLQLEVKDLLHSLAQRESEFAQELLQTRREAEQAATKQARAHAEHEQALQQNYAERQQASVQQLLTAHEEFRGAVARSHDRERQLAQDVSNKQAELIQLMQAHAALEAQLREQTAADKHAALLLQTSLDTIHASFSWRITAPLRWIGTLLATPSPVPQPHAAQICLSAAVQPPAPACAAAVPSSALTQQPPGETGISALAIDPPMTRSSTANTLDELLSQHDQDFVFCAYQTLLGREPDPMGLQYYLSRVRRGISKSQTVAQLAVSAECKARNLQLPGLDALIRRYRWSKTPVIGLAIKHLFSDEGGTLQQKLRSIDNKLHAIGDENQRRLALLENSLISLHQAVMQQVQSVVSDLGNTPNQNSVVAATNSARPTEPEGLQQLPPRARDIYLQLSKIAAHRVEGVA